MKKEMSWSGNIPQIPSGAHAEPQYHSPFIPRYVAPGRWHVRQTVGRVIGASAG